MSADPLAAELGRWAAGLPMIASDDGGTRTWRCNGALAVAVIAGDGAIEVALGEWSQRFDDDDDGVTEALELAACGLFGLARAEVHTVGDRWIRFAVQFAVGGRWSPFSTRTRPHWALWRRPVVTLLANDFTPPPGLELDAPGRHPAAPWLGVLDRVAAAGPRELVVDGELDLHPFSPKEVADVVRAYIDACLQKGIHELRIVHGKGIGNLRRTVHALLEKHPDVATFRLGGMGEGSWGATVVTLQRRA